MKQVVEDYKRDMLFDRDMNERNLANYTNHVRLLEQRAI